MEPAKREKLFRESLAAYHDGQLDDAAKGFRRLVGNGSSDPVHVSYCGLLVATAEGKVRDGRILCEHAVTEAPSNAQLHLNLARMYARTGQRSEAIATLNRALLNTDDPRLHKELERLNRRGSTPIRFLKRGHPLNRYLGRTRKRLSEVFREESPAESAPR